jgi:hypothetical protein
MTTVDFIKDLIKKMGESENCITIKSSSNFLTIDGKFYDEEDDGLDVHTFNHDKDSFEMFPIH